MKDKKLVDEILEKETCETNHEPSPEEVISMIDHMMESGVSRLKVKTSDEVGLGEIKKEYHHGRCDINSPWACGKAFDVIE